MVLTHFSWHVVMAILSYSSLSLWSMWDHCVVPHGIFADYNCLLEAVQQLNQYSSLLQLVK